MTNHRSEAEAAAARLLNALAPIGRMLRLDVGQDLFHKGDPADAVFGLEDGLLEISTLSEDGRKLSLNFLPPGAVFGEFAVLEGGTRSATVTAAEPSRVMRVGRTELLAEIRRNSDVALDMVRLAVSRTGWVSEQLETHAFQPLSARLARRLLYLLSTVGSPDTLNLRQSDLADHVGATREAVAKIVKFWEREGYVRLGRGRITICDVEALEELCHAEVL